VIPISVGGALQDSAFGTHVQLWLGHQENVWLDESAQAVENGIATEALVDRLALAPTRIRSNVLWRWVVGAVIGIFALLTFASIYATVYAMGQRDLALQQNAIAQAGRLAAESELELNRRYDLSLLLANAATQASVIWAPRDNLLTKFRSLLPANGLIQSGPTWEGRQSLLRGIQSHRHVVAFLPGHKDGYVIGVAFSPDGKTLA